MCHGYPNLFSVKARFYFFGSRGVSDLIGGGGGGGGGGGVIYNIKQHFNFYPFKIGGRKVDFVLFLFYL